MVLTTFMSGIKDDFTTLAWVMIPIGVGLNLVGAFITNVLRLPLFLDVQGTFLLAMLMGPWVAIVGGVLTNVVMAVTMSPQSLPFALTQAGLAIACGYLAYRGLFIIKTKYDYWRLVAGGFILALVSIVISSPIVVWVFGGLTGSPTDVATGFFLATGQEIITAVLSQQLLINPVDKTASLIVAYFIAINLPDRYLPEFGREVLED